jgi:hypothetical protein
MAPKWCTRMESNHRRARLQRAALPLSYLCETDCAKWSGRWEIEPIVPTLATWCSTIELRPRMWWQELGGQNLVGRDGFEPPQNERRFYRALGSPVPSLPEIGCRGGSRIRLEQLMRLPGSRTSLRESCEKLAESRRVDRHGFTPLTRFERGSGAALIDSPWRKAVVLIHNA